MKYSFYALLILTIGFVSGCSKEPDNSEEEPIDPGIAKINNWIYEQLSDNYYWASYMPEKAKTKQSLGAEAYFKSVLWPRDTLARFSKIEPNSGSTRSTTGNTYDYGLYGTFWIMGKDLPYLFQVIYVIPGSPAAEAGIERGHIFSHYNGMEFNGSNYTEVFATTQIKLTKSDWNFGNHGDIQLSRANFRNIPILYETVFEEKGKSIGYLIYRRFYSATEDSNDTDLREAIARMKEANISELILDLRYNGGGYLNICVELASMLYSSNDVFLKQEYKYKGQSSTSDIKFATVESKYQLNLDKLHIMTGTGTASASEILMHGLKQFMGANIIQYGETTVGKNVGSHAITSNDADIPWTLHAITSRLYDKRGAGADNWQTFQGLSPNTENFFDELNKNSQGAGDYYRGVFGVFDPNDNYDPALNFVMYKLGYTQQATRPGTRTGDFGGAKPLFLPEYQVLITD